MSTEDQTGTVTMRAEGRIAVITVENEAKKNAYTPEMVEQLSAHLTAFDDDELWVAVFCSAGEHTTAGLDMAKFFGPEATARPQRDDMVDPFGLGRRRSRKPVIAVVQGITYTVGIEMMLAADIVVAADTARFQQLESRRGIAPFGGAHFRYLTRTGWGNAMYHLMLCEEFDAQRARELGFVQEVVPHGHHIDRALELASTICKNAPVGIRVMKEAARTFVDTAEEAASAEIPRIQQKVFGTADFQEGLQSFVERREAEFTGR